MKKILCTILATVCLVAGSVAQNATRFSGLYNAANYNFTSGRIAVGNSSTGTATITLQGGYVQLTDNRLVMPFSVTAPLLIDSGSSQETVTPTAVSGCSVSGAIASCQVTGSFTNTHGSGAQVASASFGLQEAINDAQSNGGGQVMIDNSYGGTNTTIAAAVPFHKVSLYDVRSAAPQYWNIQQTAATFLATPATLTAVTALPSAAPVGAYTTGTYHLAIAYVDAAGQVGPESADFSEAGLATGSFIFSAPAASPGAVGYVIYISLTGGTYSLDYELPLVGVCTLTTVETVTPACAVANATYGQSGAVATATAITVSTSPVGMLLGGVSGTFLTGNPNGRTTYAYVASNHLAANGMPTMNLAFTAGGIGSATPIAVGTVNIPAGVMNQVGKGIRVCGEYIDTDVNSVAQLIQTYWDAAGSDTAGSPVKIGNMQAAAGPGTAAVYKGHFCEDFHTTVSGAGVTAGSIIPDFSLLNYYLSTAPAINMLGGETGTAAIGSLNLAGGAGFETRLSIVHTNTTGNNTPTLQNLTIEVL